MLLQSEGLSRPRFNALASKLSSWKSYRSSSWLLSFGVIKFSAESFSSFKKPFFSFWKVGPLRLSQKRALLAYPGLNAISWLPQSQEMDSHFLWAYLQSQRLARGLSKKIKWKAERHRITLPFILKRFLQLLYLRTHFFFLSSGLYFPGGCFAIQPSLKPLDTIGVKLHTSSTG